jgi:mono/diheme cytochrome c family protein
MLRVFTLLFAVLPLLVGCQACSQRAASAPLRTTDPAPIMLRSTRSSPLDLEVAGDLAGTPPGSVRYLTRADLLALPQVTYTVSDDANFTGPTKVSGASLEELAKNFAAPGADMVIALCDDRYRANYPRDYISVHHPVLVLMINDQPPERWPKDSEGHGLDIGPFLISHPKFTPSFKVWKDWDEPQIPWGVVRLAFRDQESVYGPIELQGPIGKAPAADAGYRIARQNCFRCHHMGDQGGQKAGRPWTVLATWAKASPQYFGDYIRNPKSKNPKATMPGFPEYDNTAIAKLTDYFTAFYDATTRRR